MRKGYRANSAPWTEEGATVVYLNDGIGNSIELLYVSHPAMELMGFVPDAPPEGSLAPPLPQSSR